MRKVWWEQDVNTNWVGIHLYLLEQKKQNVNSDTGRLLWIFVWAVITTLACSYLLLVD